MVLPIKLNIKDDKCYLRIKEGNKYYSYEFSIVFNKISKCIPITRLGNKSIDHYTMSYQDTNRAEEHGAAFEIGWGDWTKNPPIVNKKEIAIRNTKHELCNVARYNDKKDKIEIFHKDGGEEIYLLSIKNINGENLFCRDRNNEKENCSFSYGMDGETMTLKITKNYLEANIQ